MRHRTSPTILRPTLAMRLGINFGYQDWGTGVGAAVELAQEAERLGYHSVWTAEAYGTDAVTPLTWLMAHTETHQLRLGDHADAGAHPGDDRDDRGDARHA